jgi:hypothetical protein
MALVKSNFFLSRVEKDRLQKVARKQGISSAELLRRVINAFLGIQPEPVEPVKFKRSVEK